MDHLNTNIRDQVHIKRRHAESKTSDLDYVRSVMKKNRRKLKKKKPFPLRLVLGCCVSLSVLALIHFKQDDALDFISKINIQVSPISKSQAQNNVKPKDIKTETVPMLAAEKKEWTPEEIKIFQGLEQRKQDLDDKEKNLNALKEELERQKAELDVKLAEIEAVRENISAALSNEIGRDEAKLKKLVEVYSSMKPALAAKLFEELDEKLAIEILGEMKKANAANILNFIEPVKARRLSEKYAGYIKK